MGASTKIGGLTPKEKKFVKEYAKSGNASQAARKSYNTKYPDRVGSDTLSRERVQKAIIKELEDTGFTDDYIAKQLKRTTDYHLKDKKRNAQIGLRALETAISIKERLDENREGKVHLHLHQEVHINDKKKLLEKRKEFSDFFSKIEEGEEVIGQSPKQSGKEQAKQ